MTSEKIQQLVERAISEYRYQSPEPGSTVGVPWSAEKIGHYVELLKQSLVKPYRQEFRVNSGGATATFWVVAKHASYLEWFNPETGEFGWCF